MPDAMAGVMLDTNVVSELMRPAPDERVTAFVDEHDASSLVVCAVTVWEIAYGLERIARGRRHDDLARRFEALRTALFGERVVGFDAAAAIACAKLMATRRAMGRSLDAHLPDAMIAGCALAADLPLATRNTADFEGTGVRVTNPWEAPR